MSPRQKDARTCREIAAGHHQRRRAERQLAQAVEAKPQRPKRRPTPTAPRPQRAKTTVYSFRELAEKHGRQLAHDLLTLGTTNPVQTISKEDK